VVVDDWIAERFAGVLEEPGLRSKQLQVIRPASSYQAELNWWLAPATQFYETQ
jgi:hypothetical protein